MILRDLLRNAALATGNLWRSLRPQELDCIVLPIHGSYPERTIQRDPLPFPINLLPLHPPPEVSLAELRAMLEMIGDDRCVQTVVLRFDTLRAGLATLYSLRHMLLDLRAQGKQLVAWLPSADTRDYYLASACDEVILPQAGRLSAMGLRAEPVFLKDALSLAGVEANFEAIAEYKVSPDTFRRSTMSKPHQDMLNGILDSSFDEIVTAIAEGRRLDVARVRELIDGMPLTAAEAVEAGLADAVLYEDELAAHIRQARDVTPLLTWQEATRRLHRPIKWTTDQRIGIVSLEGAIVMGRSRRVPVPVPLPGPFGIQAGAETIIQALRRAEANKHIAAVIFYVETPGGSLLASDLIWREVRRLREHKPVVVLMGAQATSGGYYVSAPANRIVARPTTLTGSIGIWGGKFSLAGLYRKLGIGRQAVQRGAMAGLYSETSPFSEEELARVRHDLGEGYTLFKARVTEGREMTGEQVEKIARGQVWSGVQAREIGLVDELGDFETALAIAKELACLKPEQEYTVVPVHPPRRALLPLPFPPERKAWDWELVATFDALIHEHVWALAPWMVQVRG
ncbi:MAG: signal peptide peptidase SppA [Chloroflexota bacterium]|nr:signal peptide peptidase SppA [Chloroflexota bacterium]